MSLSHTGIYHGGSKRHLLGAPLFGWGQNDRLEGETARQDGHYKVPAPLLSLRGAKTLAVAGDRDVAIWASSSESE